MFVSLLGETHSLQKDDKFLTLTEEFGWASAVLAATYPGRRQGRRKQQQWQGASKVLF